MTRERLTVIQLRQRHAFRVAAMYAVAAWLLVLVVGAAVELPWSPRTLIVLAAIGLPIALVLAWIFVTPERLVKAETRATASGLRGVRKVDFAIGAGLLAALAFTFLWPHQPVVAPAPVPVVDATVAVVPFVPIGADPSLKPLGERLAEQVTNELAGRRDLRVASQASAFELGGKGVVEIARALDVSYVLEGSVRRADRRVRVAAQLLRGIDGVQVWSETYDVHVEDAAELDQTTNVVAYMVISSMATEGFLARARAQTQNADAYEHFAAAVRLRQATQVGGIPDPKPMLQILDEVDRAIALDPNFAAPFALRANVYANKLGGSTCGARCPTEIHSSFERVLTLRPDDPSPLIGVAMLQLLFDLDPAACEATLRRLRQSSPNHPFINGGYATLAMFRGNVRVAYDYLTMQVEATPYDPFPFTQLGMVLMSMGDLDGAQRAFERAMRLAPRGQLHSVAASLRVAVLLGRGEVEQAKAAFEPLWAEHHASDPESLGWALGYEQLGHRPEAEELAERLEHRATVDPYFVFSLYSTSGRYIDALRWLRRAIDDRGGYLAYLRLPNLFPGLGEQPGYTDMLNYLDSLQQSK